MLDEGPSKDVYHQLEQLSKLVFYLVKTTLVKLSFWTSIRSVLVLKPSEVS